MPNEKDPDQPELSKASRERREKKQEIRAQKDRQRQIEQRRQTLRKFGVLVGVAVIVAVGVMLISRTNGSTESASPSGSATPQSNQELLGSAPASAKDAGCTPVKNVGSFVGDEDGSHAGAQPLSEYPSVPPASGPHVDGTVAAGVYDKPLDIGAAIHSLEHGAAEIWYSPQAAGSPQLADIASWIESSPENTDHTIMAPYDYPDEGMAGSLPGKSQIALVSWHNVMLCDEPSLPVVIDFLSKYRYPPVGDKDYIGEAPEQGVPI